MAKTPALRTHEHSEPCEIRARCRPPKPAGDPILSSFIRPVADRLRGDYKQSEYGKVIRPFTVLRRLACVLQRTRADVLAELPDIQSLRIALPPLDEQRKIIAHVRHATAKFDALAAEAQRVIGRLQERRTALRRGTCQIDVRQLATAA